MFGSKKRPWKKYARIERFEYNNGDIKFITSPTNLVSVDDRQGMRAQYEDLTSAEQHLDKWWTEYWLKQVKHTRRA